MSTIALNETNFEQTISKEGIVLIDFWAPWCGPCRAFGPIFEKASQRHPSVTFAKLNTEENRGLSAALQIRSLPTLMVFRDGVLLLNQPGMVPGGALDQIIAEVQTLNMDEVRAEAVPMTSSARAANA